MPKMKKPSMAQLAKNQGVRSVVRYYDTYKPYPPHKKGSFLYETEELDYLNLKKETLIDIKGELESARSHGVLSPYDPHYYVWHEMARKDIIKADKELVKLRGRMSVHSNDR